MPPNAPAGAGGRILVAATQPELRQLVAACVEANSFYKIIGFVRESSTLLQRTALSRPDLLVVQADLLDTLPVDWLKTLREAQPRLQVMVCGPNERAVSRTLLNASGVAFLKPGNTAAGHAHCVAEAVQKLHSLVPPVSHSAPLCAAIQPASPAAATAATRVPLAASRRSRKAAIQAVVIGVSTGGPEALTELFRSIGRDFPVPIAIVQHMPPLFTSILAERLNRISPLEVLEGEPGMHFQPGRVILARGGFHMRLHGPAGAPSVQLDEGQPENSCRPAVDVLFRSAAEVFGGDVLTVVLTGMGKDGLAGAERLRGLGSPVLVQDAATSTVWGMPGAIAQAGLATAVVPLSSIAREMMRYL